MQPFLKKRHEVSVSMPAEKVERKPDEEQAEEFDYLEGCIQELMEAVKSGDVKAAAAAFQAAFQICDALPHEEGEHI